MIMSNEKKKKKTAASLPLHSLLRSASPVSLVV